MPYPNIKYPLMQAYAQQATVGDDGELVWIRAEDVIEGVDGVDEHQARNASFSAYRSGHLDKHPSYPETYRITTAGLEWLQKTPPPKKRAKTAKTKTKPKTKARTTSSNGTSVALGTLLEVVGKDEKGMLVARDTESNHLYRLVSV